MSAAQDQLKVNIGIDVQTTLGQKTGFGFYVKNLVEQLKKLDGRHHYILFAPRTERDFSAPRRWWWDQVELPRRAHRAKVDIFHQPAFSAPVLYRGKVIVTVHDLIATIFGQDIPFFSRQFFGRWMPFSYRRASRIIAISQNTKQDLVRILGIDPRLITVIYLAHDSTFQPVKNQPTISRTLRRYHINQPYLLHIGTLNPRKNLQFLIQVFAEVFKRHPQLSLVITGKFGWYYEGLFSLVKTYGLEKQVIFTGYVKDEERQALYSGAKVFTFPSLYEGFGLPPLEAMACGVPVVASSVSSIPEVVGAAGITLAPADLGGWSRAITEIINRPALYRRLSSQSLKQAKKFSWGKTARQTIEVYDQVVQRP